MNDFDVQNCVSVVQKEINVIVTDELSRPHSANIEKSGSSKQDFKRILKKLHEKKSEKIPLFTFCCNILDPLYRLDSLSYQLGNNQRNPRLIIEFCEFFLSFLSNLGDHQILNSPVFSLAVELVKCWRFLIFDHKIEHYDCYAALCYSVRKIPEAVCLLSATMISESAQNLRLIVEDAVEEWNKKESGYFNILKDTCRSSSTKGPLLSSLNEIVEIHYNRLIQAQPKVIDQNSKIMRDLETILTDGFAQDGVVPKLTFFGSRISGLSTMESDLDVSLQFLDAKTNVPIKILIDRVKSGRKLKIDEQLVGADVWRSSEILRFLRRLFQRSRDFRCDELVLGARVPIIKLKHFPTGVEV
jgi:predicted nucleotidyltransferase